MIAHESTEPRRCTVRPCGAGAARDDANFADAVLGVAALLCAFTTFRSAAISSFLEDFRRHLLDRDDRVRPRRAGRPGRGVAARLSDYLPPDSLPLTVAIFSILVYVVAHVAHGAADHAHRRPLFRHRRSRAGAHLAVPPFAALERRIAIAMVVFLVLINQAEVGITVRLNFFNRDWFNAIQNATPRRSGISSCSCSRPGRSSMSAMHGRRILHAVDAGDPLAALADRPFRVALARATTTTTASAWSPARPTTPTSASPRTSTASSTAAGRLEPGYRHLRFLHPLDLDRLVAGLLRDRAVGPVARVHAAGNRHRGAGLPVLGGADLCRRRHAGHASDRTPADPRCISSASTARRTSAFRSPGCANIASRSRCSTARRPRRTMVGRRFGALIANYLDARPRRMRVTAFTAAVRPALADHPLHLHGAVLFRRQDRARRHDANGQRLRPGGRRAHLLRQLLHLPRRFQIGGRSARTRSMRRSIRRRRSSGAGATRVAGAGRQPDIALEDVDARAAGRPPHRRERSIWRSPPARALR